MIEFGMYLIKVSACLTVFYVLYIAVFKNFTFFQFNRFYLLTGLVFSFVIPVIEFPALKSDYSTVLDSVGRSFSEIDFMADQPLDYTVTDSIDYSFVLAVVYFAGFFVMVLRFLISIVRILRIKNSYSICCEHDVKIIRTHLPQPFTFFHLIFLPNEETDPLVLSHEKVHVRQFHWIDLVLMEVASIITWFNPLIFLYKESMKIQHEYIADADSTSNELKTERYLLCLLRYVQRENSVGITSEFYYSSIKKRIVMITKNKTSIRFYGAYLLIVPVACMLLLAFSSRPESFFSTRIANSFEDENKPSIAPVDVKKAVMASGYGDRIHPMTKKLTFHSGVDFKIDEGEPVMATANGTVEVSRYDSGWGNFVVIKHGDVYETAYLHLSKALVKSGDRIEKGQDIGLVGSTGWSVGPHLHYEVRKNGKKVDPMEYLPSSK